MDEEVNARPRVVELVNNFVGEMGISVATKTSEINAKKLLSIIWDKDALEIFTVISTPKEPIKTKPALDIYDEILNQLKIDPKNAVAAEDSEEGLQSAKAAKITKIVVPPQFTKDENLSNAKFVVEDLLGLIVWAF